LVAVILPDLPPPRGSRWRLVLVGAAFLACLAVIVGVMWGIGKLATTARRHAADSASLVDHWEEPAERQANLKRAMASPEVGASAAEQRDLYRLFTRITNASRNRDQGAFLECIDLNLLVRRISQHPLVRSDRSFSPWRVKSELEAGLSPFQQVGEFSIVRVEKGQTDDLAVVYTVDWDYSLATACRWWLVRDGRNWRLFDWERLDLEQSLAHTWAIRGAIAKDPHQYNYTVLRGAIDSTPHVPGGRTWGPRRPAGADLASLIDDPLPEAVHDAAMFDLAWALIGQGRPADAIKAANALQRPQDHPGYLIIRARAYADLGRYAEALADAQEYERLAGYDPLVLHQAARALANLDRHREAAECWRTMLRLAPNHDEALSNFCRLADADQRKQLGEILNSTRQPIEAAVAQAQNAVYEDNSELFQQLAELVAKEAPDSPAAIAMQAQRLAYEGQHEQAAAEFQRADCRGLRRGERSASGFRLFDRRLRGRRSGADGRTAQRTAPRAREARARRCASRLPGGAASHAGRGLRAGRGEIPGSDRQNGR
jgi:tetratricopeptide (TPR) repeat protein